MDIRIKLTQGRLPDWLRLRRVLTTDDFVRAGACIDEVWEWRRTHMPGTTAAPLDALLDLAKAREVSLIHRAANADGDGYGEGYGYDEGYGYGSHGDGGGDSYGSYGSGSGNGSGSYGSYAYGDGDGYGDGYGYGDGDGYGYGDGYGPTYTLS